MCSIHTRILLNVPSERKFTQIQQNITLIMTNKSVSWVLSESVSVLTGNSLID